MNMRSTKRTLTCLAMALAASALSGRGVSAMQSTQGSASAAVIGTVIEAGSGQPLTAALVTLEPAPRGLLVDTRSPMLAAGRTVETGPGGGYHFTDVAPGLYRLRVERLGYRGAVVEVEVRRPVDARISVGLDLEPVLLPHPDRCCRGSAQ
jgi:hypothetical protein